MRIGYISRSSLAEHLVIGTEWSYALSEDRKFRSIPMLRISAWVLRGERHQRRFLMDAARVMQSH